MKITFHATVFCALQTATLAMNLYSVSIRRQRTHFDLDVMWPDKPLLVQGPFLIRILKLNLRMCKYLRKIQCHSDLRYTW